MQRVFNAVNSLSIIEERIQFYSLDQQKTNSLNKMDIYKKTWIKCKMPCDKENRALHYSSVQT